MNSDDAAYQPQKICGDVGDRNRTGKMFVQTPWVFETHAFSSFATPTDGTPGI